MEAVFRGSERGRGAYLSRLFAFFSEEVVRHWLACERAPYRDVGRPVIWDEDRSRTTSSTSRWNAAAMELDSLPR